MKSRFLSYGAGMQTFALLVKAWRDLIGGE